MRTYKPAQRTFKVLWPKDPILVEVDEGKKSDVYQVKKIPSDYDEAFEVVKRDGTVHHLLYPKENFPRCDCAWGTYRPEGKPCRHQGIVKFLKEEGILT